MARYVNEVSFKKQFNHYFGYPVHKMKSHLKSKHWKMCTYTIGISSCEQEEYTCILNYHLKNLIWKKKHLQNRPQYHGNLLVIVCGKE